MLSHQLGSSPIIQQFFDAIKLNDRTFITTHLEEIQQQLLQFFSQDEITDFFDRWDKIPEEFANIYHAGINSDCPRIIATLLSINHEPTIVEKACFRLACENVIKERDLPQLQQILKLCPKKATSLYYAEIFKAALVVGDVDTINCILSFSYQDESGVAFYPFNLTSLDVNNRYPFVTALYQRNVALAQLIFSQLSFDEQVRQITSRDGNNRNAIYYAGGNDDHEFTLLLIKTIKSFEPKDMRRIDFVNFCYFLNIRFMKKCQQPKLSRKITSIPHVKPTIQVAIAEQIFCPLEDFTSALLSKIQQVVLQPTLTFLFQGLALNCINSKKNSLVIFVIPQHQLIDVIPHRTKVHGLYSGENVIYIKYKCNLTPEQFIEVLTHEGMHFLLNQVFENHTKPYYKTDRTAKNTYNLIIEEGLTNIIIMKNEDSSPQQKYALNILFNGYKYPSRKVGSEIIVRAMQIIALYGESFALPFLDKALPGITQFIREHVNPHFEDYLKKNQFSHFIDVAPPTLDDEQQAKKLNSTSAELTRTLSAVTQKKRA